MKLTLKLTLKLILIFVLAGTLCGYKSYRKKKEEAAATATPAGKQTTPQAQGGVSSQFVGLTAINVDPKCRPDKCQDACKQTCGKIAESCTATIDVGQECLQAHKPKKKIRSAAGYLEAMNSCLVENKKEYEKYRCKFHTSELDYRLYIAAERGPACEAAFGEYQNCLKEAPADLASVKTCQETFRGTFEKNTCTLVTQENARRLFSPASAGAVSCMINCDLFPPKWKK